MVDVLQQLENNEAIALMHLADELSPDDRAEVDALLGVDANLRAELANLREAHVVIDAALADADAAEAFANPEPAVRRVSRMIRARLALPATDAPAAPPMARLPYPWWAYPMAAAAAILLAFLVWWGNSPMTYDNSQEAILPPTYWQSGPDAPETIALRSSFDDPATDAAAGLEDAETQMASLYASSQSASDLWNDALNP